jgi:3-dehydroquinate synthase
MLQHFHPTNPDASYGARRSRLGWLGETDVTRIEAVLKRARLPVTPPREMTAERYLELMAVDKKVLDGGLRLVLLKGIGAAVVTDEFDMAQLRAMLEASRQ